jgi:uncharacterized protein (DUF1697 family)
MAKGISLRFWIEDLDHVSIKLHTDPTNKDTRSNIFDDIGGTPEESADGPPGLYIRYRVGLHDQVWAKPLGKYFFSSITRTR